MGAGPEYTEHQFPKEHNSSNSDETENLSKSTQFLLAKGPFKRFQHLLQHAFVAEPNVGGVWTGHPTLLKAEKNYNESLLKVCWIKFNWYELLLTVNIFFVLENVEWRWNRLNTPFIQHLPNIRSTFVERMLGKRWKPLPRMLFLAFKFSKRFLVKSPSIRTQPNKFKPPYFQYAQALVLPSVKNTSCHQVA